MVELLIRDIASTNREDLLFPHLRCFDVYAGHSWASGHAKFGDGNNQESSSESMNAWYGLMLWGEVTGNTKLRDTGIFLYNTERTAVEEYWFDVSGTNFPKDFLRWLLVWFGVVRVLSLPGFQPILTVSTESIGCPLRRLQFIWEGILIM